MVDQSEDTASGEAEVPAMPISTSDATADKGATYIRDLKVLYMYKSTIWFSGNGSVWSCFGACVPGDLICNVTIVSGVIRCQLIDC